MLKRILLFSSALLLFVVQLCFANVIVPMFAVPNDGPPINIGTVSIKPSPKGLLFVPNLHQLKPGEHGFHIHENASCADAAMAAGGHLDPKKTGKHLGPYNDAGHLGDLPVLLVDKSGNATKPVLAPRLKLADIDKHALIIHEDGDNYSDIPKPLGGGGKRIACGVIYLCSPINKMYCKK